MAIKIVDLSSLRFDSSSKAECKKELENERWIDGFVCPACGGSHAYVLTTRPALECKACGKQTSATAGTQFHNCRKIAEAWPVLRNAQQNDDTNPSKSVIAKVMNVSAETARRFTKIIAMSFKKRQSEQGDLAKKDKQSSIAPPAMAATKTGEVVKDVETSNSGRRAGVFCRRMLDKLRLKKQLLLDPDLENLGTPAQMLDPIWLLLLYRSMHLPT